ncbi:MAG: sensor domain-containing diguanylate cyclase [Candidatus Omnitrophica bacterium]|nr:sensor domain-containing diguanylate cyclase [Candidatus Omnitrophota bacterium]
MEKEIERLKKELEKAHSQFYIFYELTQAMRTTLHLEEISYIILTGLTAHHGLSFNRALLFLIDNEKKTINGFMGIGPIDSEEANKIWRAIEDQKMDLYALTKAYQKIKEAKDTPKFMEITRSLKFPLTEEAGLIYDALREIVPLHIDVTKENSGKYQDDPLIKKLSLKEFVIAPLWSKDNPLGVIVVDNCITAKNISEEDMKILTIFINQAAGAIENSKVFENTLIKAHTDALTDLWNYGYFQYRFDEELMKAVNQNYKLSLMMLDLDNFKKFNDTFGHPAGDTVLKIVAGILKDTSRKIDIVARYGGEEFTLILPYANKEETGIIAERIKKTIEETKILNSNITISIGVASFDEDGRKKEEIIKKADLALYRAKTEGKDKVVLF